MEKKPLKENVHTAASYEVATYCQEAAEKTKKTFLKGLREKAECFKEDSVLPGDDGKKAKKKSDDGKDKNLSPEDRKEKAKDARAEKEKERKSKKLLPYEFTSQEDAERASGHLGLQGSHSAGNGIYKPGSSDYSLRDAVARKKQKQKMKGQVHESFDAKNVIDTIKTVTRK
jgi:hypothetical protein